MYFPSLPAASATTWLFVKMWPSESRMTPDPCPALEPLTAVIATTAGRTAWATACQSGFWEVDLDTVGEVVVFLSLGLNRVDWVVSALSGTSSVIP